MRKTMRQMHDEKREEALADVRAKVADGSLTIRQMSAEERVRYGCPAPAAVRLPLGPG
jgi:hypothetical protein